MYLYSLAKQSGCASQSFGTHGRFAPSERHDRSFLTATFTSVMKKLDH